MRSLLRGGEIETAGAFSSDSIIRHVTIMTILSVPHRVQTGCSERKKATRACVSISFHLRGTGLRRLNLNPEPYGTTPGNSQELIGENQEETLGSQFGD
ncbi:MAG: hypothetical protein KDA65_02020 [Planctomycetaceae bacterium]|nr:hypothetical protein [Planctomycetaceae bacterium]